MILRLFSLVYVSLCITSAYPFLENNSIDGDITTTVPNRVTDYFEYKVNKVASVSCDVCLSAVYGINYNVIRLKKAAEDMIRLDCEALFHGQPDNIGKCIRIVVNKIEEYYNKVEPVLDTRNVCVRLKMCAPVKKSQ